MQLESLQIIKSNNDICFNWVRKFKELKADEFRKWFLNENKVSALKNVLPSGAAYVGAYFLSSGDTMSKIMRLPMKLRIMQFSIPGTNTIRGGGWSKV